MPVGVRAAGRALTSAEGRAGLRDAIAQIPWVIRHRRAIPATTEAALRTLERQPRGKNEHAGFRGTGSF
jgi:hypothetical protein